MYLLHFPKMEVSLKAYLKNAIHTKTKVKVDSVSTNGVYEHNNISEALLQLDSGDDVWKIQFYLNSNDYFRLVPKWCDDEHKWSPLSEKKLRFLCSDYNADVKASHVSNMYIVDQHNTIPFDWYKDGPNGLDSLKYYWKHNRSYFAQLPNYVERCRH